MGGWEGGEDCLKGVRMIWSSSDYSYVVDGSCNYEQWVITIKLSHRKLPSMAPIMVIMSDNTLDKDTPVTRVCVHACRPVCLRMCFIYVCLSLHVFLQHPNRSFQPEVSILSCRGGSGHWALYEWSSLFLLAWLCLSAESWLVECDCAPDVHFSTGKLQA